jgi:hypothetical protein
MARKNKVAGLSKRVRGAFREAVGRDCRGELTGRRRLLIQGCERILDFDEACIRLSLRDGEVDEMIIRGRALYCQSYHPDAIVIIGEIKAIELLDREDARED